MHLIEDSELSTVNMLVYGHPGMGKTPFWGTGGARLCILDSDEGYESAMASGSKSWRMPVRDYKEMEDAYEFFETGNGCKEFDWVVWDSLTLFQDRSMIDDLMVDASNASENQSRWVPSRREYFVDHNRIGALVRQFVALPINFGISCHVMDGETPLGDRIYMPAIQGKNMSSKVCGYMNIVAYMGKNKEHKPALMFNDPAAKFYSRDRFSAMPTVMIDPTVAKIDARIKTWRSKSGSGATAEATQPRKRKRIRPS